MNIKVYYTKYTDRGRDLLSGEGEPTVDDFFVNYVKVYELDRTSFSLDDVYTIFNGMHNDEPNPLESDAGQQLLNLTGASHTSMSVGDIIQIDDKSYLCIGTGWKCLQWHEVS